MTPPESDLIDFDKTQEQLLRDQTVTEQVQGQDNILLVGPSGAGKSTIAQYVLNPDHEMEEGEGF